MPLGDRGERKDPGALSTVQREALRRAIRERGAALRAEIAQQLRQCDDPESIHLANHLDEIDDAPIADLESALEIAALERDFGELRALEAALARLDGPRYGVCTDCGAGIPFGRLMAEPAATRCVRCQSRAEGTHGGAGSRSL